MSTPEERRRTARRLREQPTFTHRMLFENVIAYLCDAVSDEPDGTIDPGLWTLQSDLADLIDPTCKITIDEHIEEELYPVSPATCDSCGQLFWYVDYHYEYCPHCGARIVEEER